MLLAESEKASFSLILPSRALGELSEHTYLWEFIWWSLQLAFIISNTSQIVRWCMGGLGKVVWQHFLKLFTLRGEHPQVLAGILLTAPCWATPSMPKVKEKQRRSLCSWLLCAASFLWPRFAHLRCWVLSVPDRPRSQPSAWQHEIPVQKSRSQSPHRRVRTWAKPTRNFVSIFKSFWGTNSVFFLLLPTHWFKQHPFCFREVLMKKMYSHLPEHQNRKCSRG